MNALCDDDWVCTCDQKVVSSNDWFVFCPTCAAYLLTIGMGFSSRDIGKNSDLEVGAE